MSLREFDRLVMRCCPCCHIANRTALEREKAVTELIEYVRNLDEKLRDERNHAVNKLLNDAFAWVLRVEERAKALSMDQVEAVALAFLMSHDDTGVFTPEQTAVASNDVARRWQQGVESRCKGPKA